jgi:hypothetical protein
MTEKPSGPGFLIIGAQRAGTSWLWRELRAHPDIWMPAVKELHWFDRSPTYPSPSYFMARSGLGEMVGRGEDSTVWRRRFARRLAADLPRWELVRWDLAYFLARRSDDWYLSLFGPGDGRVRGEATPAYAMLADEDVERIATLLPDVRIVFCLRDPIERAWSQLRQSHGPRIEAGAMSIAEMRDFVDSPGQELRSDYARTIAIWSQYVPKTRFQIAFYDHLVDDPQRLLESVCAFVGADPARVELTADRLNRFGPALPLAMPAALRRHLAQKYVEPIERLAEEFGEPPSRWLEQAETVLRGSE